MRSKRTILSTAALVVLIPLVAAAQTESDPHRHDAAMQPKEKAPMTDEMRAKCQAMMAHHQAMQEHMQAMDAELDRRVATMRSATGDAKADATAAVVETLVEQRKSMHSMMLEHQPKMMRHMMEHMGRGEGMSGCPMMQRMGADEAPDAAEDDHSAHHPG